METWRRDCTSGVAEAVSEYLSQGWVRLEVAGWRIFFVFLSSVRHPLGKDASPGVDGQTFPLFSDLAGFAESTTTPFLLSNAPTCDVQHSPPTPLPDFYIDEYLKDYLRVSTAEVNIEELEELRTTCLASVWRHRTKWDRTAPVGELLSIAKEFVQEVLAEDAKMSS